MRDMGFNYKEAEESRKKFVRYKDGRSLWNGYIKVSGNCEENAVYKVNQMVLVNTEILERYLERYRVTSKEEFR